VTFSRSDKFDLARPDTLALALLSLHDASGQRRPVEIFTAHIRNPNIARHTSTPGRLLSLVRSQRHPRLAFYRNP
jgi:hypothetical protein